MKKKNVLNATLVDSFKMMRNFTDGTSAKSRRYVYQVTGGKDEMDLYKADTINKTNIGGVLHDDGRVLFYSWQPGFEGTVTQLIRSESKSSWFLDTSALDKMNSMAVHQPDLVKLLADNLLDRFMGKVSAPNEEEDEKPKVSTDDEGHDIE